LKKNSDFLFLKNKGQKIRATSWLILNSQFTGKNIRLGITASRKVGPAVLRNKLKRWTKEFFRKKLKENHEIQCDINVVFLPSDYEKLLFSDFNEALEKAFIRIRNHRG
jgi:ribonuclease P protein component